MFFFQLICLKTGLTLLFDLNVLLRTSKGNWNTHNARKLMKMSSSQGFRNIAWELGNEPNSILVIKKAIIQLKILLILVNLNIENKESVGCEHQRFSTW